MRSLKYRERDCYDVRYARCSTNEDVQDIDRQVMELKKLGIKKENVYLEYESGAKTDRIEFNRLLEAVAPGDTIAATEVSRLTRAIKADCYNLHSRKS